MFSGDAQVEQAQINSNHQQKALTFNSREVYFVHKLRLLV